jgi:hypothetical protein
VIPDWGGRDLKLGTARAAVQQLGIDWQDFQNASHEIERRCSQFQKRRRGDLVMDSKGSR